MDTQENARWGAIMVYVEDGGPRGCCLGSKRSLGDDNKRSDMYSVYSSPFYEGDRLENRGGLLWGVTNCFREGERRD